jgi:hypothetical protein
MGSLLAWLCLPCTGDAALHKTWYNDKKLTLADRMTARMIGSCDDNLVECFQKERFMKTVEKASNGEPRLLA